MKPRPAWVIVAVVLALIPGLAIFIVLALQPPAVPAGKGCQPSLLHSAVLSRQNAQNRAWAHVEPESAGIAVYLEPGSVALQAQVQQELLWMVDGPMRGDVVEVFGLNSTNGVDYIRQSFARDGLMPTDYRGVVRLPSAGCWEFDVKSGTLLGKVTFWVPE